MSLSWKETETQIRIEGRTFRIVWEKEEEGWRDRVEIGTVGGQWRTIAQSSWHLGIEAAARSLTTALFEQVRLGEADSGRVQVEARLATETGELRAHYVIEASGVIRIAAEFAVTTLKQPEVGVQCLRFRRPDGFDRPRLHELLPSGWSGKAGGVTISSEFLEDYTGTQMALAFLDLDTPERRITLKDQGIGLSYPPAYRHGRKKLLPGQRISGNMVLYVSQQDAWAAEIEVEPGVKFDPPATISPQRYPYRTYIENWGQFIRRPELWVELGDGMGLFHRGFYQVTQGKEKMKVSGILEYRKRPDGTVEGGFTGDDRLIELAWGGVANVPVAEAMWKMARMGFWPEAADRVKQMLKAILHFKDGGFQVKEGPCRGAWWNGYIVEQDRFASRYGRDHVETPNQGIVNYHLYRLIKLGATADALVTQRIVENCTRYLKSIERADGSVEYAKYIDGRQGEGRQFEPYEEGFAAGVAMAGLS